MEKKVGLLWILAFQVQEAAGLVYVPGVSHTQKIFLFNVGYLFDVDKSELYNRVRC